MAKSLKQQITETEEKVTSLQVVLAGLQAKVASVVDPDKVVEGADVTFEHGKGENKKTLRGLVLGRKNAEPGAKGGDLVKVAVGEGFDAQVLVINPGAVSQIHVAEAAATDALNAVVPA